MQGQIPTFDEGTSVRLRHDRSRIGRCTGRYRERAGIRYIEVNFGTPSFYPENDLEPLDAPPPSDEEALRTGRFGRASELRRQLTHIQLSGGLADVVYSMNTTNTDFYAHQYKPVLSFLESPSHGLLIADEVGLGKTIEAGLIWTELRARNDARRLLVVCPKMLCDKWYLELRNRFGVEARIVSAKELADELERPHPEYPANQAFIASMQGIRPPGDWDPTAADLWSDEAEDADSRSRLTKVFVANADRRKLVDLVIIDEAHYMRNPKTATHRLGLLLREISEHIVLLSATPINLKSEDLFSLLNLVDPDNFQFRDQFESVLSANEPVVRARYLALDVTKSAQDVLSELSQARQHSLLRDSRQLESIEEELKAIATQRELSRADRVSLAARIERVNSLSRAVTRSRKVDVTEKRVVRVPHVLKVKMSDKERDFYEMVTAAIREYAQEYEVSDGFLLATPQRQLSSCMVAAATLWAAQGDEQDNSEELLFEDLDIEIPSKDLSPFRRHLLAAIEGQYSPKDLYENDSKFHEFSEWLEQYLNQHREEKVVLFSYFRGTLQYLSWRLEKLGIGTVLLMGGGVEDKSEVIERFRTDVRARVLLSSEVASEGVDLQFCRVLVNYDLPWNPMKVEQRIGRIDRLGQIADKIDILNLVYDDTVDARIVERLYERLDIFKRALGGIEAVLGEEIQKLTADLLTEKLTPEQEAARVEKTAMALENRQRDEQELEQNAGQLLAHSDFILQKVRAAQAFSRSISSEDIRLYVRDYLDRYGQGYRWIALDEEGLEVELALPPSLLAKFERFASERRLLTLTRLAEGTARRCRFVNRVGRWSGAAEQINQFHPLVRFISHDLSERKQQATPLLAVRLTKSESKSGLYAFVVHRWNFGGLRPEEVIRARVVDVHTGDALDPDTSWEIVNKCRVEGEDWLGATAEPEPFAVLASDALVEADLTLSTDYEIEKERKQAENEDRVQFQLQGLRAHRDRKVAIEQQRIATLRTMPRARGLAIAAEEEIQRLKTSFSQQEAKINSAKQSRAVREAVTRGVISIE
jgi:SNF2-related domain/Helicase conserved C-terminal domain